MNSKQITKKLDKLAAEAKKYDFMVTNTLGNARRCGRILLRMKKIVVKHFKHGHWEEWLKKNIPEISLPSLYEYMRVAKNWHDPALKKARGEGEVFTCIRSVLDFLAKTKTKNKGQSKPQTKKQKEAAEVCEQLRETFNHFLRSLTHDELLMFNERFNPFEAGLWEKVVDKLHHLVYCKLEYDPYEYVKDFPQDGNYLFDRRRKFQMVELTKKVARLRVALKLNKKRASKKKLQELRGRLKEREGLLQNLEQFMEN